MVLCSQLFIHIDDIFSTVEDTFAAQMLKLATTALEKKYQKPRISIWMIKTGHFVQGLKEKILMTDCWIDII